MNTCIAYVPAAAKTYLFRTVTEWWTPSGAVVAWLRFRRRI